MCMLWRVDFDEVGPFFDGIVREPTDLDLVGLCSLDTYTGA